MGLEQRRNTPVVDLSPIKARIQTLNFRTATVFDVQELFHATEYSIRIQHPPIGLYDIYRGMRTVLPKRIPSEMFERAALATRAADPKIRKAGEESVAFLVSRSIITSINLFLRDHPEYIREKDDLVARSLQEVMEKFRLGIPSKDIGGAIDRFITSRIQRMANELEADTDVEYTGINLITHNYTEEVEKRIQEEADIITLIEKSRLTERQKRAFYMKVGLAGFTPEHTYEEIEREIRTMEKELRDSDFAKNLLRQARTKIAWRYNINKLIEREIETGKD